MTNAYSSIPGNGRTGQGGHTCYWQTEDWEYALITNLDWSPVIWQRPTAGGAWTSFDLSATTIGVVEVSDSHHGVSVGVSADGIIYVAGNTHDNVNGPTRLIRSTAPHDITDWETAPYPEQFAKLYTNLVENGAVENVTTGWSALDARFTLDRVTHSYGWGSTHGNDTDCKALRLTRTASSPDSSIQHGTVESFAGGGFPATPGETYHAALSMRCGTDLGAVNHQIWLVFRSGVTEVSRVASTVRTATNATLWYRPTIYSAVAPLGVDNVVIEYRTTTPSGNATTGNQGWADGAMLVSDDLAPYDLYYRDGAYGGGLSASGWVWNGTPYESTSTGPLVADGYAGLLNSTYPRFSALADGTLLLSHTQGVFPNSPIGRRWSMWKMAPGQTNFSPLVPGTNTGGAMAVSVVPTVKQGATYPILTDGNIADDSNTDSPDRCYCYGLHVDINNTIHIAGWFRLNTSASSGRLYYARSKDQGVTWETAAGDPVTMPITLPDAMANPSLLVSVGVDEVWASTYGGMGVDDRGHPSIAVSGQAPHGPGVFSYDEAGWTYTSISMNNGPTVSYVDGRMVVLGTRVAPGSTRYGLREMSPTGSTPLILAFANVTLGTPDGVYAFESTPTYEGAPVHAGGSWNGRPIYRTCIPHGDEPRIISYGDGVRQPR